MNSQRKLTSQLCQVDTADYSQTRCNYYTNSRWKFLSLSLKCQLLSPPCFFHYSLPLILNSNLFHPPFVFVSNSMFFAPMITTFIRFCCFQYLPTYVIINFSSCQTYALAGWKWSDDAIIRIGFFYQFAFCFDSSITMVLRDELQWTPNSFIHPFIHFSPRLKQFSRFNCRSLLFCT